MRAVRKNSLSTQDSHNNLLASSWDLSTQTPHGGQDWRELKHLVEDFSVTTNGLGPVPSAMTQAQQALTTIEHYPASDQQPALSDLANYLDMDDDFRLLLGNGASELVDLLARLAPIGPWKPGPFLTQYQEYRRSATNHGRAELNWSDDEASLVCLVNPCNPTGDYFDVKTMKEYIEATAPDNSWVLVDESMQPWLGENWKDDSLVGQYEWVKNIGDTRNIQVFVIHSWTKIWACPGIRIGSVVCPSVEIAQSLRTVQVPWSLNSMALAYLSQCTRDVAYMESTWKVTSMWRSHIVNGLKRYGWDMRGQTWSSWIWIDTGSMEIAEGLTDACKNNGVPIRWGKFGYNLPTYIRIGVRNMQSSTHLLKTIEDFMCLHGCDINNEEM